MTVSDPNAAGAVVAVAVGAAAVGVVFAVTVGAALGLAEGGGAVDAAVTVG